MNFCGLQVKMYYNNNTLFKYLYTNKHDIRYIFEKVDREKRFPNWTLKYLTNYKKRAQKS